MQGVGPRATGALAAAKRLRWEVDWAIEQDQLPNAVALSTVAELAGVVTNILVALEKVLPSEPSREPAKMFDMPYGQFKQTLEYYIAYHKFPR